MSLQGGCLCGAVRYEADVEPGRTTHCHCVHCRRSSGAPLVTWTQVPTDRFRWVAGEPGRYASRAGVERTFCRGCGTQLTFVDSEDDNILDITAGSLDDPDRLQPEDHVWCDRRIRWMPDADGLPRYARSRFDG